MEQQKKDKILALVTTIVLHIVVLFVLWLTFLGKEPVGTGSGVLKLPAPIDPAASASLPSGRVRMRIRMPVAARQRSSAAAATGTMR